MQVTALRIPPAVDEPTFQELLSFTDSTKKVKIGKFRARRDAERALLADVLTRVILSEHLGLPNQEVHFALYEFGKPYLADHPNIGFNYTHSGDWIACAMDDQPVGIDVEQVQEIDMEIARHYFANEEYEDLMQHPHETRLRCFYDLWTLKESFIKLQGKGLQSPLDSFAIRKLEERDWFMARRDGEADSGEPVFFKQYEVDPVYRLSVCALHNDFPERLHTPEFEDFLDRARRLNVKNT